MLKLILIGAVGLAIAYVVYTAVQNQAPATELSNLPENQVTLTLEEQNDSAQTGTVTLVETDGKVEVTLTMTGGEYKAPQPAHIHTGTCPNVGAVVYPLTNVVDGTSTTTINTTIEELKKKLPMGINVHKSAAESKVYTACGDLAL